MKEKIFFIFFSILLLLLPVDLSSKLKYKNIPHLDTAVMYYNLNVKEKTGNNDGYYVEKFLKSVGLKKGSPWCAAFVSYCLIVNKDLIKKEFFVTSGLANNLYKKDISFSYVHILLGLYKPVPGDIVIWKRGETIYGHTGFVYYWNVQYGYTIEGNVQNAVRYLKRSIEPLNYFRIVYFTPIRYKYNIEYDLWYSTDIDNNRVNTNSTR